MSLEIALKQVRISLQDWQEALTAFRRTVVADRDLEDTYAMVRELGEQLLAFETDCRQALLQIQLFADVRSDFDVTEARRALQCIHSLVNTLAHGVSSQVAGYDIICQLEELRHKSGTQWQRWLRPVRQSIEGQPALILAVQNALAGAWAELADAASRGSVTVKNVAVGQQFIRDTAANGKDAALGEAVTG
jgi:hypothetical protein